MLELNPEPTSPIALGDWMARAWDLSPTIILLLKKSLRYHPAPKSHPPKQGSSLGLGMILRRKERHAPAISLLTALKKISSRRSTGLGIDLAARGHEVRKLFYSAFARGLVKDGYDPEDALQEVYRGLLARNAGSCPFDAQKSSFGHYVHIVTRCILANYVRKERRRRQFESYETQLAGEEGDRFSLYEIADSRSGIKVEPGSLEQLLADLQVGPLSHEVAQRALGLLAAGHSKREVCQMLNLESSSLDGMLAQVKTRLTS